MWSGEHEPTKRAIPLLRLPRQHNRVTKLQPLQGGRERAACPRVLCILLLAHWCIRYCRQLAPPTHFPLQLVLLAPACLSAERLWPRFLTHFTQSGEECFASTTGGCLQALCGLDKQRSSSHISASQWRLFRTGGITITTTAAKVGCTLICHRQSNAR